MPFPMNIFTPNHVQLLNACFPPSSSLLTSGPNFAPNSQELSKLTYYASNHPGKLTKLGNELDKRVKLEARKARTGNQKARVSLLMSLSILRSLVTESRRDIALLSSSLIAAADTALSTLSSDLEVCARTASVFNAWTTYTDGHLIGADSAMTKNYLSVLRHFTALAFSDVKDEETRNRTRLIGFAAITGALNSEALYNDSTQFKAQVSIIMRPILITLLQTPLHVLDEQASEVKSAPMSPYLAEFRNRPTIERRAASIHAHVDGDKGPAMSEVSSAGLHALFSLLEHANASQLGYIMRSSFDNLDEMKGWNKTDHCCWFANKASEWSQYQNRYVVPTWLVERLTEGQDVPETTSLHRALAAMVTTVFNSPTPLINLSTSDVISNLMTLLTKRIALSPKDSILPALVQCISSLGSHVYYSDQIQDLAGEIISRMAMIELQGLPGENGNDLGSGRAEAIRCLLASLLGLLNSAQRHDERPEKLLGRVGSVLERQSSTPAEVVKQEASDRSSRRTRVPPDIWQDTLSLICDVDYSVRADYADGLISYVTYELPKKGDSTDIDGVKRVQLHHDGPVQGTVSTATVLQGSDFGTKFLNAIHGHLYVQATAGPISLKNTSSSSSLSRPNPNVGKGLRHDDELEINVLPATPQENDDPIDIKDPSTSEQSHDASNGRKSMVMVPRLQKAAEMRQVIAKMPSQVTASCSTCLADYTHILDVLTVLHQQLPIRGLLYGIPMLLALDAASQIGDGSEASANHRMHAIKLVVAQTWLTIGKVWESHQLVDLIENALKSVPEDLILPSIQPVEVNKHHSPREPIPFASSSPSFWEGILSEDALRIIVNAPNVQSATGLNAEDLHNRLSVIWSVHSALSEPVERSSTLDSVRNDHISPLLKISPALMHIENISLQSLTRAHRGVGVTDLREALEGRSSMSNPALVKPASISTTVDRKSSIIAGDSRLNSALSVTRSKKRSPNPSQNEVQDVLNKLKIGSGKQNGSSLLKSSFAKVER